jgi:hypothetical protein
MEKKLLLAVDGSERGLQAVTVLGGCPRIGEQLNDK